MDKLILWQFYAESLRQAFREFAEFDLVDHCCPFLETAVLQRSSCVPLVSRRYATRRREDWLSHNATRTPNIDTRRISPTPEQYIRRTIPQRDDLVTERVDGDSKRSRQSKVGQFEFSFFVDEQILGFEISMEDAIVVTERCPLEELPHEGPDDGGFEGAAFSVRIHVLFEIEVHEFEDEHELGLGVDDVVEADDVGMLELFHEGDFSNGGGGSAFFCVEVDLLECDELRRDPRASLRRIRPNNQRSGPFPLP